MKENERLRRIYFEIEYNFKQSNAAYEKQLNFLSEENFELKDEIVKVNAEVKSLNENSILEKDFFSKKINELIENNKKVKIQFFRLMREKDEKIKTLENEVNILISILEFDFLIFKILIIEGFYKHVYSK